jgi:thiol-disulfide isomerase/thioredoxin
MPGSILVRCTGCGTLNRAPSGKAGMQGRCGRCGAGFTVPPAPCGYCVRMAPAVEELARELGGRLKVATMDVSKNSRIPSLFEVRGTPSFVLMKGGREAARFAGAMPKEELFRRLKPYI